MTLWNRIVGGFWILITFLYASPLLANAGGGDGYSVPSPLEFFVATQVAAVAYFIFKK